ncbi:MAG: prephenate dehydrogenase [Bacteroidota bacterium]|nr:prephenate dehydrogenase [Bacteroidota bacterium]
MTIGIIGLGRFGKLTAEYLSEYFNVVTYDIKKVPLPKNLTRVSLKEAASQLVVVLAVPIRQMESTLQRIASYINEGALVCDVSSVKEKPVEWMKKYLPKTTMILGTHPMFGPDTVLNGLKGNSIVLSPVRIKSKIFGHIKRELRKLGLIIYEMLPTQHDRLMAETQALIHFISRGYQWRKTQRPATRSYIQVSEIFDYLLNDSKELFEDINKFNRYARPVRQKFINSLSLFDKKF